MSDHKKVSVIIPVYQVENYLERAVDSVLEQTLSEMEIILVDEGSEYTSPQICDRYDREYPDRIRVIHKENEGLGMARNTGVRAAVGEYIAFLDSDDTVEPEMYEELYERAVEENYDMVMCDVKIIYVEEDRSVVVSTYSSEEIDLSDYIANGNNITYSVNKLYSRRIWEENQYEKMLFEDIALIPSLITKYQHIGYVKKPFYNYYRRANTISTTFVGDMVDIVQAFRYFIDRRNPKYREEVVYNTAKQLYWNLTQSRVLFQADFIELLKEYKKDFLLNPYIQQDKKIQKILDFLDREVIPNTIICVHINRPIPEGYWNEIQEDFPNGKLISADQHYFPVDQLPETIQEALAQGRYAYAEEYYALKILYEEGGIVLCPEMRANLNLKKLRLNRIFFGFEDEEEMTAGCFGALREHYVIRALLDSYEEDHIYNKAFLPLRERIRDFLMIHFRLKVNGRNQLLKNEVQVYLPSVLAYDMKNGENCCKKVFHEIPEGYELVRDTVLKMWSDRLMENWNLYKRELNVKRPSGAKPIHGTHSLRSQQEIQQELEGRIQEVVDLYENSTCWKLTKPIRVLGKLFGK